MISKKRRVAVRAGLKCSGLACKPSISVCEQKEHVNVTAATIILEGGGWVGRRLNLFNLSLLPPARPAALLCAGRYFPPGRGITYPYLAQGNAGGASLLKLLRVAGGACLLGLPASCPRSWWTCA